ncbi:MAG: archease [Candidatus Krumholzibacteria bacterium]|nr:archease [Candidatus Krumholzibacteria bacterium]
MLSRGHETIDHTADMGIRGWGSTPAEALEEAAAAMLELMADVRGLVPSRRSTISRAGSDLTELLIEFLNGLLSDADLSGTVYLRAAVTRLEKTSDGTWALDAAIEGVPLDEVRERLRIEVKAATYCGASVREQDPGVWVARCVVDL